MKIFDHVFEKMTKVGYFLEKFAAEILFAAIWLIEHGHRISEWLGNISLYHAMCFLTDILFQT